MERGDGAYALGSADRGFILRRLAHRPDTMQDWAGMVAEGAWAGCIFRQRYYPPGRVTVIPRQRMELSPIRRRESLTGRWGHRCISYCITMQPRKGACCLAAGCSIGTARICEDGLLVWADDRRQGCSRFRFYLQGTVTYPVRILPNSSKD